MSYGVTFAQFLADPLRIDTFLVEVEPYDVDAEDVHPFYYSSGPYVSAPTDTPAQQVYIPRATVALNAAHGVRVPGTVSDAPAVAGGEIRIGGLFGDTDALLGYLWNGRTARVLHAGYSPAYGQWVARADARVLYEGEIAAVKIETEEAVIELRQADARLAAPMQTSALLGSPWMLHFDGSSTQVKTAGPEPKLGIVNDLTAEFRIYIEALPASEAYVVGFYGGTAWPWAVTLTSGGALRLKSSTTTYHTTTTNALSVKRWYHVAVAVDSASTIFYVCDQLTGEPTTEVAASATGRPARSGSPGFAIGCAGAASYLNGYVHHVRVWSAKRTASEIDGARWRRLTSGEEVDADLKGLWRFEDGGTAIGGAFDDRVGDASDLTTTQATISAVASGNKFTRGSGSFSTDGWVAGMRGLSSGFGTAANNALFTVATVSATELAVTGPTLVNESSVVAALLTSAPLEVSDAGAIEWVQALEGQSDVAGTLRPLAYGRVESAPGILVGVAPNSVFLFSSNKASAISAVYVGGVLHTLDTAYTDLTTFLLATTDPAKYDTLICDSGCYVRLGTAPSFPVTIDGRGDATGSGYVETAGAVARRIATTRGPQPFTDPGEIDTTAFSALDSANSAPVGAYAFGDEQVADVVGFVLGSVSAFGFIDGESGKLAVSRFGGVSGTPVAAVDERHIESISAAQTDAPVYAIALGYGRQYVTLSIEQIAGIVIQQDDPIVSRLLAEYRYARVENGAVLTAYPRASVLTIDTGLATEADAIAEGQRLLPLYAGEGRAYKLRIAAGAVDGVAAGDVLTISLRERTLGGAVLTRLGLGGGGNFVVMEKAPVADEGLTDVTVWKGVV